MIRFQFEFFEIFFDVIMRLEIGNLGQRKSGQVMELYMISRFMLYSWNFLNEIIEMYIFFLE